MIIVFDRTLTIITNDCEWPWRSF